MSEWMKHRIPPERITWYHAPWLLDAEAGRLKWDKTRYPIHGVSNNALTCIWCGLLEREDDGPILTELGARLLGEWKQTGAAQIWLASVKPEPVDVQLDLFDETPQPPAAAQLDLLGEESA